MLSDYFSFLFAFLLLHFQLNLSFTLKEFIEMGIDFYPMPSFPSVVADAKDIDTSISTAGADLLYTGPLPGPSYLTFASSKV